MQTILALYPALPPILQWLSSFLAGSTNYFKTAAQMDRENVSPCPYHRLSSPLWGWPWPPRPLPSLSRGSWHSWSPWWHLHPWSPWLRVIPAGPAPVLKAKDGDILGFVFKLAYIGLHHHCILKTCPYPTLLNPVKCSKRHEWKNNDQNWWMGVKESIDF